jgi:hypothetical protein
VPRVVVASLTCLAGLAAGFAVGRLTYSSPPADVGSNTGKGAAPRTSDAGSASDVAAIQELSRQIDDLRKELSLRDDAGARHAAGISDADSTRLLESMATLSERLQSVIQLMAYVSPARDQASDRVHATGKTSLTEIDALTDVSMESMGRVSDDWREAHLLWTVPQVIDRYGLPTNVFAGQGQITLEYLRPRGDGVRIIVDFVAYDGFVTQVRVTH